MHTHTYTCTQMRECVCVCVRARPCLLLFPNCAFTFDSFYVLAGFVGIVSKHWFALRSVGLCASVQDQ